MRGRGAAGQDGGGRGLHRDHAHRGLSRLQHLANAGDRPARTDAGDHGVHPACGVIPNLLGRGNAVDQGVRLIVELLGHHGAGNGLHKLFGATDRAGHPPLGGGQLQPCPQEQQHFAPLHRHALGHTQDQLVAFGGGDKGQRNSGIAAGGFDDGVARLQQALGLKALN